MLIKHEHRVDLAAFVNLIKKKYSGSQGQYTDEYYSELPVVCSQFRLLYNEKNRLFYTVMKNCETSEVYCHVLLGYSLIFIVV